MSMETIQSETLGTATGEQVLDLGCGEGRHAISQYLSHQARMVGVDLNAKDLNTARQRLRDFNLSTSTHGYCEFIHASGLKLPFADATFDKVICSEVLEHIPDYPSMLDEIRRVLKPQGRLAVSVPRFVPEWICWRLSREYHEVEGGHIRIFRTRALKQAIESRHFKCYKRHWAHALHVPYWWLRCLFWHQGEQQILTRTYHRLLVWDLLEKPWLTQTLERLLNPILGKSVVLYFHSQTDVLPRTAAHAATLDQQATD